MQDSPQSSRTPILLIDESLADRPIAQALRLVDYNAIAVTEQLGPGADDPSLINWLGLQGGIWVTADERARRQHSDEITRAGIHMLWVRRPRRGGLSKRDQLFLLLGVLDPILDYLARARAAMQFRASYSGARPKLERL